MKYHKIKNVDISVCTAEQKIAYNVAFNLDVNTDIKRKYRASETEIQRGDVIQQGIDIALKIINGNDHINGKFDIDSIICSLRAGMKKYLMGYSILTNYKEIGETFPAEYLTEK